MKTRVHRFSKGVGAVLKVWEDMKPNPYSGPKYIKGHRTKFILPDDLAPRMCAPVAEMLVSGEGLFVRFCEHGDGHWD